MYKSYLKINNNQDVLEKINKIPFTKHGLVINGLSSFEYYQQDFDDVFKIISDKFISMVGEDYKIHDFWINKYLPSNNFKFLIE